MRWTKQYKHTYLRINRIINILTTYYTICQGCCLTGAWAPGAPSIYPRATKISNRESNGRLKLMILKRPSSEKTAKFPVHFALWNDNVKRLIVGHRQKNISAYKGIHTALCLEIRFCDFHCRAVEVPRQKMASNAFNSLRKNFDNKIMTFPSALETLGPYYMK